MKHSLSVQMGMQRFANWLDDDLSDEIKQYITEVKLAYERAAKDWHELYEAEHPCCKDTCARDFSFACWEDGYTRDLSLELERSGMFDELPNMTDQIFYWLDDGPDILPYVRD